MVVDIEDTQIQAASLQLLNIQLNLNVYPATLAGFAVELDISFSLQPSLPVRITHDYIYVADPQLFTYITFNMLIEYEYLSQQQVPSNTYEAPFELPLAPDTLAYLEDAKQPGNFLDANEAKRLYGMELPYNPLSRFQLVVLPGEPGPQSIKYQGELARGYFQQHQDHVIRATRERQRRDPDFKSANSPPVADPGQKTLAQYFQEWENCIQRSVLENRWIPNYTPLQPPSHTVYSQAQPYVQEIRRRSSSSSRSSRYDCQHHRRHSSFSESSKSEASEKKESHSYMPMILPLMGAMGGGKSAQPAPAPAQGPVSAQAPVTRERLLAGHHLHERYPAQARHGSLRKEPSYGSMREPAYGIRKEPSYELRRETSYGDRRRSSYRYRREQSDGSRRDAAPRSRPSTVRTRTRGWRGVF